MYTYNVNVEDCTLSCTIYVNIVKGAMTISITQVITQFN